MQGKKNIGIKNSVWRNWRTFRGLKAWKQKLYTSKIKKWKNKEFWYHLHVIDYDAFIRLLFMLLLVIYFMEKDHVS
jgi:hypothetical protein